MVPRENKNNAYTNFGRQTKSIMVFLKVAYGVQLASQMLLVVYCKQCAQYNSKRLYLDCLPCTCRRFGGTLLLSLELLRHDLGI